MVWVRQPISYDPPKYNFQSRIIKFSASSIRTSLFVAIIVDDDNSLLKFV